MKHHVLINRLGRGVLAVSLGLSFLCAPRAASAQLGALKQTVANEGVIKPHNPATSTLTKVLNLEPADFTSKVNGLEYELGFRDDRVSYARIYRNSRQTLEMGDLLRYLSAVPYIDETQKPKSLKWQAENRFYDLFPPLGKGSTSMKEILKDTGVLSRSITFEVDSGRVVNVGDWRAVMRETGQYVQHSESMTGFRVILRSHDGSAFAIAYKYIYLSTDPTAVQEDSGFDYLAVMSRETFYDYLIGTIAASSGPAKADGYEGLLARIISSPAYRTTKAQRLALAMIRYAELSEAPLANVIERYHKSVQDFPETESFVANLLLKSNFPKLGPGTRERHYQFVGEVGGPEVIGEILKKMPIDGDGKELAVRTLARIAERHDLPTPPGAAAPIKDLRSWGAQFAPAK